MLDPYADLTHFIASAGALGTAAYGLAEAAKKSTPLGRAGMKCLKATLGTASLEALKRTYGKGWEPVLQGAYRKGSEALADTLRNGLKVALDGPEGPALASSLNLDPEKLRGALRAFRASQSGGPGPDEALLEEGRKTLGVAELALNARVEGAVAAAEDARVGWIQIWAGALAIVGAVSVAFLTSYRLELPALLGELGKAFLLGLVAVPIAPLSKDLMSLLKSAKDALARR